MPTLAVGMWQPRKHGHASVAMAPNMSTEVGWSARQFARPFPNQAAETGSPLPILPILRSGWSFPIIRPIHEASRPSSANMSACSAGGAQVRICHNSLASKDLRPQPPESIGFWAAKIFDNKHLTTVADSSAHPVRPASQGAAIGFFNARQKRLILTLVVTPPTLGAIWG
jgi:hypothetical protein